MYLQFVIFKKLNNMLSKGLKISINRTICFGMFIIYAMKFYEEDKRVLLLKHIFSFKGYMVQF